MSCSQAEITCKYILRGGILPCLQIPRKGFAHDVRPGTGISSAASTAERWTTCASRNSFGVYVMQRQGHCQNVCHEPQLWRLLAPESCPHGLLDQLGEHCLSHVVPGSQAGAAQKSRDCRQVTGNAIFGTAPAAPEPTQEAVQTG